MADNKQEEQETQAVEILGLEIVEERNRLAEMLYGISLESGSTTDSEDFANDSLDLARENCFRRRIMRRRNSSDSYANDSLVLTRKARDSRPKDEVKDTVPVVTVLTPLVTKRFDADNIKDMNSSQLASPDLDNLTPLRVTNRAA